MEEKKHLTSSQVGTWIEQLGRKLLRLACPPACRPSLPASFRAALSPQRSLSFLSGVRARVSECASECASECGAAEWLNALLLPSCRGKGDSHIPVLSEADLASPEWTY